MFRPVDRQTDRQRNGVRVRGKSESVRQILKAERQTQNYAGVLLQSAQAGMFR